MTTAIIVQARMGSTRLPGKVLKKIGMRTVIEEVIMRCRRIQGANVVVCAIPDLARDDVLLEPASRAGAVVVRGSETDVLSRYVKAARAVDASVVARITADCPLIDPEICGAVLQLREREGAEYASNALELSYPKGLDCEAFTADALAEADAKTTAPNDREHVTPWLINAPTVKRANLHSGDAALARLRWTLDYPEDLTFLRAIFAVLPVESIGQAADVLKVIEDMPAIAELNSMRNSVS